MARVHVEAAIPALALRRPAAAAALGVSVDTFDREIRHELPVIRVGNVVTYPVGGLQQWISAHSEKPITDQLKRAA